MCKEQLHLILLIYDLAHPYKKKLKSIAFSAFICTKINIKMHVATKDSEK